MTELIMTPQREVILDELKRADHHPSADEIYERVRRHLPKISLGTVYRNLEILARAGQIRKLETPGAQRRFDANTKNHYHLRCVQCGRVDDAPVTPIATIENLMKQCSDYEILEHHVEFVGLCPRCRHFRDREYD